MIRLGFAALAISLTATPLAAQDARLGRRLYDPDEVVRIDGRTGVQAAIVFGEDEHIENVAIGDANSWQVTPNKRANILFVKPLGERTRTNLTVVTDKRSYFFDLVASAAARPLYALRFTYPTVPKPEPAQGGAAPDPSSAEAKLVTGEQPIDPARLNFAWLLRGKRNLLPSRIYDDGGATYLSWPAGAPIPAIQVRNETGEEGPANFAVRGDVIVIDGVPELIVLRSGKNSAMLENTRGQPRRAGSADGPDLNNGGKSDASEPQA